MCLAAPRLTSTAFAFDCHSQETNDEQPARAIADMYEGTHAGSVVDAALCRQAFPPLRKEGSTNRTQPASSAQPLSLSRSKGFRAAKAPLLLEGLLGLAACKGFRKIDPQLTLPEASPNGLF